MKQQKGSIHGKKLLGESVPTLVRFQDLETIFQEFFSDEFRELSNRKKFKKVNKTLLQLIQEHPVPCFLLSAVLAYVEKVNQEKLFEDGYSLAMFEFWLNHFSGLSSDEILFVRGKIVGRFIPREEYQVFFPVGMGRMHAGSHFVAAHLSPDVDTTTASFWGWADAFGCRVSEGIHQWSLPSGLSDGHIVLFFKKLFGETFFKQVCRPLHTMTLNAMDLLNKKDFHLVSASVQSESIDHSKIDHAIIVVDEEGLYRGEWRSQDAETVHQIAATFSHCLRWFESHCQTGFIKAFSKEQATVDDVTYAYEKVFATMLKDCAAIKEIPEKSKKTFHEYLQRVIGLPEGVLHTFRELLVHLDFQMGSTFSVFFETCESMKTGKLFDVNGRLQADRARSAQAIERIVETMGEALEVVRCKIDSLEHLLEIKEKVFCLPWAFVTLKSDVDEMRAKIGHFEHLTVVAPEKGGKWIPLGVVRADVLRKNVLGTVSFRDFSNAEETKMASYVDVISIVDHHKTKLQTSTVPTLVMGDVQSSNTLVAEQSLNINKKYGARVDVVHHLLETFKKNQVKSEVVDRVLATFELSESSFFVDPTRELSEYFSYLYGIIDDTDLLTRVSRRDVFCVKGILDRMRSLVDGISSEAVSFSDIPNDHTFIRLATKRLLQNHDLHSIYSSLYTFREQEIEQALLSAIQGQPTTLFLDTKEQNGCCRVGQMKLFHKNLSTFEANKEKLLHFWQEKSEAVFVARPHVDFFLQMVTTVPGEREVFFGEDARWTHRDELWAWIPETGVAEQHLIYFLNNFQASPTGQSVPFDIEIVGSAADTVQTIFAQNFPVARSLTANTTITGPTVAIFRFPAGAVTTRKSQLSPYLPKIVP